VLSVAAVDLISKMVHNLTREKKKCILIDVEFDSSLLEATMSVRKEMTSVLSATEARIHFGEVIKRAYLGGEHLVVERDGIPVVVILSFPDYERLMKQVKLARFERLSLAAGLEAERQGLTEERLEAEMERIKEQLYEETYG
jgi:prevent-host-death family protein